MSPNDELKKFRQLPIRTQSALEGSIESLPKAMTKAEDRVHKAKVHIATKGADAAFHVLRTAFDIWAMREKGDTDRRIIEAETEQLRARLALEIGLLKTESDLLIARGDLTLRILETMTPMLDQIPELDSASRLAFLAGLPEILKTVMKR